MAKKNINDYNEEILPYSLSEIVKERYSRYAKYIIQERALPDARDGLKPVQRRILFAMENLNLTYKNVHKKSARIVGEVIGKYHPHGDSSVYEAMVRMSQNWKSNMPLVDMHGNNGSIDGDPAAAMRYTEARLSKAASFILQDLHPEIVNFVPNFDDSETEPYILPSPFPNLLVNGANGIAAGYATNIPPHNLNEVIDAIIYRIKNKKCSIEHITKIIKGPDFPTAGIIQGKEGIQDAYKTGKGKIIIRSKIDVIDNKIIITEIPYEISKKSLIQKIDLIRLNPENNINIKKVEDETDKQGLRIVIEVANIKETEYVKNFLLKKSNLQVVYNFNMIAIVEKKPRQCSIIELIDAYINHRVNIIIKKSRYELKKATHRLEIVLGLIKAIKELDHVISIIRKSNNKIDAQNNLIEKFHFTKLQAEAIVLLRLYRLTSTDINLLKEELNLLKKKITELTALITSHTLVDQYIRNELLFIKSSFNVIRKSKIEAKIDDINITGSNLLIEQDVFFTVTKKGYIKLSLNNGRINKNHMVKKDNDLILARVETKNTNVLMVVTNRGNYISFKINEIPIANSNEYGVHISKFSKIDINEVIVSVFVFDDINLSKKYIAFFTKKGLGQKIAINALTLKPNKVMNVVKLKLDDEIISTFLVNDNTKYFLTITKDGMLIKYNVNLLQEGRPKTIGNMWVKFKKRDFIIDVLQIESDNQHCLLITTNNEYKRININDVRMLSSKPALGIKSGKLTSDYIKNAFLIKDKNSIYYFKLDKSIHIANVINLPVSKLVNKFRKYPVQEIKYWNSEKYYTDIVKVIE